MSKYPVVACVGGGQLARMLATEAGELGISLRVLAADSQDPAALVCPQTVFGHPDNPQAIRDLLNNAQVLTFEHELIPDSVFDTAATTSVPVRPSSEALLYAKDKIAMRSRLGELAFPIPDWADGNDDDSVVALGDNTGWQLIAKVSHGGYDGRGVCAVNSWEEFVVWRSSLEPGRACLVEQRIAFTREISVLVARSPSGQIAAWEPVQTWQEDGQCSAVLAPAPDLDPALAERVVSIALRIGVELGITGVYAVEMFLVENLLSAGDTTQVYVNELAMRPHNSGHWTQNGCVTSQFEQHLRAVLDLPLGETALSAPYTAMANVLGSSLEDPAQAVDSVMQRYPKAKIHLYRKSNRPKRKLGHVNVSGADPDEVLLIARQAANMLMGK